jgi:hypothetical protein
MLKTKVRNIIEGQFTLAKLIGGTGPDEKPIAPPKCSPPLAYSLWLIRKGVMENIEFFDAERSKVLTEADLETDEGREEALRRVNELLDTEIRLPNVGRIALSRLDREGFLLLPTDFVWLEWLLKFDIDAVFETDQEETNG